LGVQLLNRTTRRINLTDSGRQYYQQCVRLLAELEEAEQLVSSDHASLSGTIRIAAPLSFGILHLSPVLDEFLQLHPDLNLDLDLDDRQVNLMNEAVDLGIRIGKLEDSSLIARRLAPAKRTLCASPDYLKRYGEPRHPEELKHHQGLSYSNMPEGQLWQFMDSEGKLISVRVPFRMRANNGDVLQKAAIDGLGILGTVNFMSYQVIEQGLLIPIMKNYLMPPANVYAIYPAQQHLPQKVRALIDYLAQRFGDNPYWDQFSTQ
ncbi:MAG TPA: LysR substrate-binding domain-containing protein, partial [Gammaproteobacteria bacterium]